MKRTIFILGIGLLFLFPFLVSAKDNVHITAAEVVEKSDDTVELEKITFEGLALNYKISFQNVNDYIRYKVTIQNDSNKDYEISDNISELQNSDYFLYQFHFDEGSNIVKAHSSKNVYLTARYMKEINSSLYENGKFVEVKQMKINFANDSIKSNPSTNNMIVFILIGAIAAMIGLGIALNNRGYLRAVYGVFVLGVLFIPFIGYALDALTLEVNSEIEVLYTPEFCYYDERQDSPYQYFEYTPGITMSEYLENHDLRPGLFHYNPDALDLDELNNMFLTLPNNPFNHISDCEDWRVCTDYYASLPESKQIIFDNLKNLYFSYDTTIFLNNPILDKSVGCYQVIHK